MAIEDENGIHHTYTHYITPSPVARTVPTVSPPSGSSDGGETVTISGAGFGSGGTVTFDDIDAVPAHISMPWTDTRIVVRTPPHAPGTVDVVVRPTGASALSSRFTYTNDSSPFTVSASPTSIAVDGVRGSTITARVTDVSGRAKPNVLVDFDFPINQSGGLRATDAVTNGSGIATTYYTPDAPGEHRVTATADGVTHTVTITATADANAYQITLGLSLQDLGPPCVWEVLPVVRHPDSGAPVEALPITLTVSGGTFIDEDAKTLTRNLSDGEWPGTAKLVPDSGGDVTVTATVQATVAEITFAGACDVQTLPPVWTPLTGESSNEVEQELSWSPDGAFLASKERNAVWVYSASNWQAVARLDPSSYGSALSVAFSPGGDRLAVTTNQGWLVMYRTSDWAEEYAVQNSSGYSEENDSLAWSRNGSQIAILQDYGVIRVRWAASGAVATSILTPDANEDLYAIAWGGNSLSQLAAGDHGGNLYIGVSSGRLVRRLSRDIDTWSIAWSHDGSKVAFVGDGSRPGTHNVLVLDSAGGAVSPPITVGPNSNSDVLSVDWAPDDSSIVVSGFDTGTQIISIQGTPQYILDGANSGAVAWQPNGDIIATSRASSVQLYSITGFAAPSISLSQPSESELVRGTFKIRWTDSDPDSDAIVDLFAQAADGSRFAIATDISEDDETNFHDWDVSGDPNAQPDTPYRVVATIWDGLSEPVEAASAGTIELRLVPSVESLEPATGRPGNSVTITGSGFRSDASVYFGVEEATVLSTGDTELVAIVPAGENVVPVRVENPGGLISSETPLFQYASGAFIAIEHPAPGDVLGSLATSVVLDVVVQDHDGPWQWRVDTPFPADGPALGNTVPPGRDFVIIEGLAPERSYTVYVALVDTEGAIISPSLVASTTFSTTSAAARDLIAFTSSRTGDEDVYVANPDGSGLVNLTQHPATDGEVTFSPGGAMVAFTSNRDDTTEFGVDGEFDIYSMSVQGVDDPVNLTNHPAKEVSPAWSPDGQQIAFITNRNTGGEHFHLYIMDADGSNPTPVREAYEDVRSPSWHPDGNMIAFRTGGAVWIRHLDTGAEERIPEPSAGGGPSWSPDGTRLAYWSGTDVHVFHYPDGPTINLTQGRAPFSLHADWSPDGLTLVYMVGIDNGSDLYMMNANGSNPVPLASNHPTAADYLPAWSRQGGVAAPTYPEIVLNAASLRLGRTDIGSFSTGSVEITNTGDSLLAVTSITSDNGQFFPTPQAVTVAPGRTSAVEVIYQPVATGWEVGALTFEHNASSEPSIVQVDGLGRLRSFASLDGTRLAFHSRRNGNLDIYTMALDGSDIRRVTEHPGEDLNPKWSPDSSQIVFQSDRDGDFDIYIANGDGSDVRQLTQNPYDDFDPDWSAGGGRVVYASMRDGRAYLYEVHIDGSGESALADASGTLNHPVYSPDGAKIAFYGNPNGARDIFVMDADGSDVLNITDHPAEDDFPEWHPDGSRLLFRSRRDGNPEIHTMQADGSQVSNLTQHGADDEFATWSPDGSAIVFHSTRDGTAGIYTMAADGSDVQSVGGAAGGERPAWSPTEWVGNAAFELVSHSIVRPASAQGQPQHVEPGEVVNLSVRLRNISRTDAEDVRILLAPSSDDITVTASEMVVPAWAAGVEASQEFELTVAEDPSAAEVAFQLAVVPTNGVLSIEDLSVSIAGAGVGPAFSKRSAWTFDPTPGGNKDGSANPNERVQPRIRLRNDGSADARNVEVSVTIADPAVAVIVGTVSHDVWGTGQARNNNGLLLDITADATAHDVAVVVDVTADNGGPWQFIYTFSIVQPPPSLAARSIWARDKVTGNANGVANPGERVEIRARIMNESETDFQNIVATLSSSDDVTFVNGQVTHATWPSGVARNNDGLLVDIGFGAMDAVSFTLDVTADNGGPWQFTYTLPVVPLPVSMSVRNFWARDRVTGNGDGVANSGERVEIKARLKHEGSTEFQNVVVTLSAPDPGVDVVNGQVTHATWPAGVARNNDGLLVDFGPSVAGPVAFTLDVTADNGGPWQFTYTLPVTGAPVFEARALWGRDKVTGNEDGEANPGERVEIKARIKNSGLVDASNVLVTLTTTDPNVTVVNTSVTHATWPSGVARNNDGLVVDIGDEAVDVVTLMLDITADNGGPWRFTYTLPVTLLPPSLSARSFWARDRLTGNGDGIANSGERVEIKARLKHEGSTDFQNVVVTLSALDSGVDVANGQVTHATWPAGVARNNDGLLVDIGPSVAGPVVLTLDVTADNGGPWQFTYTLPVTGAPVLEARALWGRDKVTGNEDGEANPGERIEIKARIRNTGLVDASNVLVTLTTTDPNVTVVNSSVTHATWPSGVARNNDGLVVDIGDEAVDVVTLMLDITADNGGPWQFTYTLPVTLLPPSLSARSFWARDKVTGNANAEANPGERVEIKARLKNDSVTDYQDIVVRLRSEDDVTVVNGQVTHATWPAGVARNNDGLVVHLGGTVADSVSFTLDVTASNGGPWKFRYTLPIVALPPGLAARSFWARDKTTGNADGDANPGERVQIKARLKNEGDTSLVNVVSTLSTVDSDVVIVNGERTYASWGAGGAKNNDGLLVDIGSGASGSVAFTLDVTADNGGPWQFTYTLPVVTLPSAFALRSTWPRDKTTGDADGLAEPGERVELRVRMKNEGQIAAENVVVTLSTTDVNATVASSTVTHATWPAGEARNNAGFLVDLGESVGGTVSFTVDIDADGVASKQFTFDLLVAVPAAPSALVSGLPALSALLPNYPNPFNPETWIPFDLAKASEVTVTVYDVLGTPVRRMELGHREPGAHRARGSAAYWDGRNGHGETASSGTYIVELRAGAFRELRRILLLK
jgi:TolB protein